MALRFNDSERRLTLGVHDLIEAGPRSGHLRLQAAVSRTARLAAGREAHQRWQQWRSEVDEDFQAEQTVKVALVVRGWECLIRGRVDGLSRLGDRVVVEELKSTGLERKRLVVTSVDDWPDYTEQVCLYRWLLHASGRVDPIGRLVLVSLIDGARHVLQVDDPLAEIRARVEARLDWILRQRELRNAWMATRRASVVPFAHDAMRPIQVEMVADAAAALDEGQQLLLSAPTGTGKTAAVLHAALTHAYARDRRVFVATAKGTQQRAFEKTLRQLAARGLPMRTVTIRAKEKCCLNTVVDCRPEACPFAERYHDRAPAVVEALLPRGVTTPDDLIATGDAERVCPFELSLDFSEHADVVVGDYNYVFNPQATLRRHFADKHDDWVLVVDEAHNLVERAQGQLSPELSARQAHLAARTLTHEDPLRFSAYVEICLDLAQAIEELVHDIEGEVSPRDGEAVVGLSARVFRDLRDRVDELALDYALVRRDRPAADEDLYLELSRALIHFVDVLDEAEKIGEGDEIVPIFRARPSATVKLVCLDPSPWMSRRLAGFGAVVLMSATLEPPDFYRDLLGLDPERMVVRRHDSPFPPENLRVLIAPRVSTAWRDRIAHRDRTATLIQGLIEATPGNVAVFYSAFSLLNALAPLIEPPRREALIQEPRMDEAARWALVDRLRELGPPRVLHAVLGGIFAEGIDLPGGILDAVVIVGPALPKVGLARDLMRQRFEDRYDAGFRYAFLVPGMSRVVQAAGRLVRGPQDRGVVVLVGRRFGWRDYAAFFPEFWGAQRADDPSAAVAAFWGAFVEARDVG
ncbi:MAG: ATP-dependent DNA helicase [Alphaproteobacteria bacterium]|nr:ATP-dependent DNA helicase [Alphaproteobacteria bacterium]